MTEDRSADLPTAIERAFARLAGGHGVFKVADVCARPIHAREAALVAASVERRRHEFASGRWCAAQALGSAGAPYGPILRGALREPLWPQGFTGSITHHGGIAAAAVKKTVSGWRQTLGIDLVDTSDAVPFADILPLISVGDDDLGDIGRSGTLTAPTLLALKEAAIKCLSPQLHALIDFKDLRVSPAADGHRVDHAKTSRWVAARSTLVAPFVVAYAETC